LRRGKHKEKGTGITVPFSIICRCGFYGLRQIMVILDGIPPMITPPLIVSTPPHDAFHLVPKRSGVDFRRKGVDPSEGHVAPPDIKTSPYGQQQEV
jgi:hypothetical protein